MVSAEAIKQKLREAEQSEPARNAPVVSAIKRPAVQSSDTKAPSRPPSQRRGEKSAGRRTKPKELSHKRRQPVPSAPAYVKPTATPRQLLNLAARSRNARLSLTPSQTSAVTRTSFLVKNRLTGVDPVQTEDALVRAITAFQYPAAGTTFRDQLVRELRRCYEAGTAQRTADRVLAVAPLDKLISTATSAEGGELVEVPVETASAVPHEVLIDRDAALRILTGTDVAEDFASVLEMLKVVFRSLRQGVQPHITSVFLRALDNRFAVIVVQEALRRSRRGFAKSAATLEDVQELPTTRGIVILDGGSRLSAWDVTPEHAVVSSIELNALRSYLRTGQPPDFNYEIVGPGQKTPGPAMRDLAGIAHTLRSRDHGIHPVSVDAQGQTKTEWSLMHLRRMGAKSPHRVREHLRTVPATGRKTVVQEHARHGLGGAAPRAMRIRIL